MASGNIVLTYINEMYLNMFPKSLPIISADKDNLGEIILKVLDKNFNDSLVKKESLEYVKRYHNYKNLGSFLLEFYQIQIHNGPLDVFKLIDANIGEKK